MPLAISGLRATGSLALPYSEWISASFYCTTILNSVRQHNHFITQGDYKATCFDYRLVILRPILSIVSQDAMHTLGSHNIF